MQQFLNISESLGGLPVPALIAVVILSGFALAAWAIYAVMSMGRSKKDAD